MRAFFLFILLCCRCRCLFCHLLNRRDFNDDQTMSNVDKNDSIFLLLFLCWSPFGSEQLEFNLIYHWLVLSRCRHCAHCCFSVCRISRRCVNWMNFSGAAQLFHFSFSLVLFFVVRSFSFFFFLFAFVHMYFTHCLFIAFSNTETSRHRKKQIKIVEICNNDKLNNWMNCERTDI